MSEQGSRFLGQSRARVPWCAVVWLGVLCYGLVSHGGVLHCMVGWDGGVRQVCGYVGRCHGVVLWYAGLGMLARASVSTPGRHLFVIAIRQEFRLLCRISRWHSWVKGCTESPQSEGPDCQLFNSHRGQKGGEGQVSDVTPAPSLEVKLGIQWVIQ